MAVCLLGVWADPVRAPDEDDHDHGPGAPVQYFTPPPSAPATAAASPSAPSVALPAPVVEVPLAEVVSVIPITSAPTLIALVAPAAVSAGRVPVAVVSPSTALVAERFTANMPGDFPEPPYPRWARQQGLQGNLLVLVEVSAAGAPVGVVVRESCGSALLDAHALEWVRRNWTWGPGSPRRFLVPFVFQLR